MELLSVIIPVYKVERYLQECVDSVLSSTYSNLEVILVDDGSPDNCPSICDAYAAKYSRIKVLHQENQGLCAARNAGLHVATGQYIAFVDSDDIVSPFLYKNLVDAIEAENADWAACNFTRELAALPTDRPPKTGKIRYVKGTEALLSVFVCAPSVRSITWTSAYVWNKLYRKDAIIKPFLAGCLNIEDLQFNWDYAQNNPKLAIISAGLYFYRVNEESITETYRKSTANKLIERSQSMMQINEQIAEQVSSSNTALKRYMIARTVSVMHGALFRMHAYRIAKYHPDISAHAKKYIKKHWRTVWQEKETYNLRIRLPVALFKFSYPLWLLATQLVKF